MDRNNKILAVAVVALLLVVAASSIFMFADNGDTEEKASKGSGRLLVYGNADNDDYFDEDDVKLIQKIVDENNWDKTKNPFADANHDTVVDQNDVEYARALLNKESNRMWYIGSSGNDYYFNYPAADRSIAVSSEYGLMLAQVLGVYDKVTAGASSIQKLGELRYPGIGTMKDLGTYNKSDYPSFIESLLDSKCTILLGQVTTTVYDLLRNTGKIIDLILLSPSAEVQEGGIDVATSILTAGILLDAGDNARKYVNYCDRMTDYISENMKGQAKTKFVCAYNTNNPTTTTVHTTNGKNGAMTGVIWTLSFTPMWSDIPWNELDTNGRSLNIEMEYIIKDNPDVIVLAVWGKATAESDPAEVQAMLDEKAKFFKETDAYKNGRIYGINYEAYGTYLGVGGLALLCSYIWPDSFSTEEGWSLLQEAIDNFTMIKKDVHELGGLIPYKINTA